MFVNSDGEKEGYIGSVRFFKHVILSCVGLAVLIPLCLSIAFGIGNYKLRQQNEKYYAQMEALKKELAGLYAEDPEAQATEKLEQMVTDGTWERKDWQLLLVNESHPLEDDFKVELVSVDGGQKVDVRIADELNRMMSDMRKEGMRPIVCSGYRTIEKQSKLFDEYIKEKLKAGWEYSDAFFRAKMRIALPGTSEHHTGLAVDIVGMSHQSLDDGQADTKEAKWLAEHCTEYGFILRYPEGKTDITGIDYESWHFRYVGAEAAAYIMENELTLEEFIEAVDKV